MVVYLYFREGFMKTPCEIIVWQYLPVIRKEIAKSLINDYNFSQREVAKKLGLTESTVSRYLSGKRGKMEKLDESIIREIKNSAKQISKENGKMIIQEICRICDIMKSHGFIKDFEYLCKQL